MSMEDHPMFFGKDASNLPNPPHPSKQPTLFEMMNECDNLIRATQYELEQLDYDIRFLLIVAENLRG